MLDLGCGRRSLQIVLYCKFENDTNERIGMLLYSYGMTSRFFIFKISKGWHWRGGASAPSAPPKSGSATGIYMLQLLLTSYCAYSYIAVAS